MSSEPYAVASETLYEALLERLRADLAAGPPQARFLSKEALADHYGVAPRTVKTWREKGLPGHKVGREVMYEVEAVNRWIEGRG